MPLSSAKSLQSIRSKLLAAAAIFFVAFVVTLTYVGRSLAAVGENARLLHVETLPLIQGYREIETSINSIILLADRLPGSSDEIDLDDRLQELAKLRTVRDRLLDALPRELPSMSTVSEAVDNYVDAQGDLVRRLLSVKRKLAGQIQRLTSGSSHVDELLEDAGIDNYKEELSTDDIDELRLGVLSLSQATQLSESAKTSAEVDALHQRFRTEFRGIGPIFSRLREDHTKLVADLILDLVDGASGPEGVFENRRLVLGLSARIKELKQVGDQSMRDVGELAGQLNQEAKAMAALAERETATARRKAVLSIGIQVAVLGLTALVILGYVERRIVRRLKGMVGEISRLSQGELEVALTPGGEQELADLARAAEVFRQNSLDLRLALDGVESRNAQLAEFAYVASHDLKSPLRAIANLACWVREDCEGILPEESADHLERMIERAHRMETLLEDLLRYSRTGHDASPVDTIELGKLLRDIVDLLASEGELAVELPTEPMVILTQRPPLELVLRNLLANALAHSDEVQARVSVQFKQIPNSQVQIDLIDNGPGIAPAQREKVFGLFTRLDNKSVGTGLGLAMVRRTSEAAGGAVVVMEREGRGAHLRVTWPHTAAPLAVAPGGNVRAASPSDPPLDPL